ncbi:hypothetical protein [Archangium sp.]|uniref:hypothetical protein n=1 Tax=Archangium sp. TaxID=1872627 RepID=UPI002D5B541D|nr:hypothetical protein [Archangium sp.]HYO58132.1 hypothetical protein [Archangium sp.]
MVFSILSAGTAHAEEGNLPANEEKKLLDCLTTRLQHHVNRQSLQVSPVVNDFTWLFLAEQYGEQLAAHTGPEPFSFTCWDALGDKFVNAYLEAAQARASQISQTLGPGGTRPLESDDLFIRLGNNLMGGHVRGHSDITHGVLTALDADDTFSADARDLLEWSSQATDLYYWDAHSFHAHSKECTTGTEACEASIAQEQEPFVSFLEGRLNSVASALQPKQAQAVAPALFQLGGLLHAVQDLVYHRGMTMTHHSGLSYYLTQNPDLPKAQAAQDKLFQQAQQLTRRALQLVKARVGTEGWNRLRQWKKPNPMHRHQAIAEQVKGKQDMTLRALLEYIWLSRQYPGKRNPTELQAAAKGYWDPEAILTAFETKGRAP